MFFIIDRSIFLADTNFQSYFNVITVCSTFLQRSYRFVDDMIKNQIVVKINASQKLRKYLNEK